MGSIPKQILEAEAQYLIDDRELYLIFLNQRPLSERKTYEDVVDGVVSYFLYTNGLITRAH
jgi:hypothetical protein